MKASVYLGMGLTALAITSLASPASAKYCRDPDTNTTRVCPPRGFGDDIPVTLPPDRHPPKGKDSGIPVRADVHFGSNAQLAPFRPK